MIDWTLSGTTTSDQRRPVRISNQVVLHTIHISRLETSLQDEVWCHTILGGRDLTLLLGYKFSIFLAPTTG